MQSYGAIGSTAGAPGDVEGQPGLSLTLAHLPGAEIAVTHTLRSNVPDEGAHAGPGRALTPSCMRRLWRACAPCSLPASTPHGPAPPHSHAPRPHIRRVTRGVGRPGGPVPKQCAGHQLPGAGGPQVPADAPPAGGPGLCIPSGNQGVHRGTWAGMDGALSCAAAPSHAGAVRSSGCSTRCLCGSAGPAGEHSVLASDPPAPGQMRAAPSHPPQVGGVISSGQRFKRRAMYAWSADTPVQPGSRERRDGQVVSRRGGAGTSTGDARAKDARSGDQAQQQRTQAGAGGFFGSLFRQMRASLSGESSSTGSSERRPGSAASSRGSSSDAGSAGTSSSDDGDESGLHMYGAAVLALRGDTYFDPITSQVTMAGCQERGGARNEHGCLYGAQRVHSAALVPVCRLSVPECTPAQPWRMVSSRTPGLPHRERAQLGGRPRQP